MKTDLILRGLVIADVLLGTICFAIGFFGDPFLIEPCGGYAHAQREAALSPRDGVLLPFDLLLLVLAVFAWIALWRGHCVGRLLYTVLLAASMVLLAFEQPIVSSGVSEFFVTFGTTVGGVILGLLYFSDLKVLYAPDVA